MLGANVVWCLVIFGWTFAMMAPFFYVLKLCGFLRISAEEEEVGVVCQSSSSHTSSLRTQRAFVLGVMATLKIPLHAAC